MPCHNAATMIGFPVEVSIRQCVAAQGMNAAGSSVALRRTTYQQVRRRASTRAHLSVYHTLSVLRVRLTLLSPLPSPLPLFLSLSQSLSQSLSLSISISIPVPVPVFLSFKPLFLSVSISLI